MISQVAVLTNIVTAVLQLSSLSQDSQQHQESPARSRLGGTAGSRRMICLLVQELYVDCPAIIAESLSSEDILGISLGALSLMECREDSDYRVQNYAIGDHGSSRVRGPGSIVGI